MEIAAFTTNTYMVEVTKQLTVNLGEGIEVFKR